MRGPLCLLQGTNGGVTLLGAAACVAGGLFVGTISYVVGAVSPSIFTKAILFEAAAAQWQLIPLGVIHAEPRSGIDNPARGHLYGQVLTRRLDSTPSRCHAARSPAHCSITGVDIAGMRCLQGSLEAWQGRSSTQPWERRCSSQGSTERAGRSLGGWART